MNYIPETQTLSDGETIVSAGGRYDLVFFSPGASKKRYLGIWYKKISVWTVIWVANREVPLNHSSGTVKVINQGILVLLNYDGSIVLSSNSSRPARNPVAQLLDSGTFLPGMKLGRNLKTGLDRYLSSWKTPDDPSHGNFTYRYEIGGFPELKLREGSIVRFRSGPWKGMRFTGTTGLKLNPIFTFGVVFNKREHLNWIDRKQGWDVYTTVQKDNCNNYALCGAYGSCSINNSPVCSCLKGFVPKFPNEWDSRHCSNGCVRKTPLNCSTYGFLKYSGLMMPDSGKSWFNYSINLDECKNLCTENCSCTAYANLDIRRGGSGCLLLFVDLVDIRMFTEKGQEIFVRMAASELGLLTFLDVSSSNVKSLKEDLELPLFDLATIACATDNFSIENKLGEGAFGSVYKGVLKDGEEIAVKRLSKSSKQGLNEFTNEVKHIAKLQHRNLVKLLGCCIEAGEKLLIYEYMPNKSMDFLFFDQTQSMSLDWPMRNHIINGIARGLLYLHRDSRQRIIHRDLKEANILLDNEMNPKISDFGLARSFGEKETTANTKKVVGTYGYMSPESAIDGLYSIKSDVFSFGVLVLETVSGKRNIGFYHPDHHHNLLGHAWRLFRDGNSLVLFADPIKDTCNDFEVLRSIHVGPICCVWKQCYTMRSTLHQMSPHPYHERE
ncbi:hypothetical protein CRYUN_Cryun25bG0022500 [Craigia yunnanensis]